MQVSISQAHKMTGVARSTIYKDIDAGKLSTIEGARGRRVIDVSELQRVYGAVEVPQDPAPQAVSETVLDSTNRPDEALHTTPQSNQVAVLQERIKALQGQVQNAQAQIERENEERSRERRQFEERIASLEDALKLAQEGHNKATLLLENKDSGSDERWQQSLQSLEDRISNQEEGEKTRQRREQKILLQNQALRKALQEERDKGVFAKIFK